MPESPPGLAANPTPFERSRGDASVVANDDDQQLTLGDLSRTTRAITALLHHLAHDPYVKTAWSRWAAQRGITPADFDAADLRRVRALARIAGDDERARFADMVRDELRLPFSWAPSVLHRMFQLWTDDFAKRQPRRIPSFWPAPDAVATLPRGRGPRDTFARDVEWYYRVRVKRPPDTIAAILREVKKADPTAERCERADRSWGKSISQDGRCQTSVMRVQNE